MTQTLESEVRYMCNLSQGVAERAMEKGVAQGENRAMLTAIRNLMETLGVTSDKAMDALKVPEADRAKYKEQLRSWYYNDRILDGNIIKDAVFFCKSSIAWNRIKTRIGWSNRIFYTTRTCYLSNWLLIGVSWVRVPDGVPKKTATIVAVSACRKRSPKGGIFLVKQREIWYNKYGRWTCLRKI